MAKHLGGSVPDVVAVIKNATWAAWSIIQMNNTDWEKMLLILGRLSKCCIIFTR